MNGKKMELEKIKKMKAKMTGFYVIWNGLMLFGLFSELPYMGAEGYLSIIPVFALWNYLPTVLILYVAKVRQTYPGIGVLRSIWLTSILLHGKDAIPFLKLWIRCLLIVPVAKEFAEEKRILELQASATDVSERPRYVDL